MKSRFRKSGRVVIIMAVHIIIPPSLLIYLIRQMTVDMRCAQKKRRYERLISSHVYGVCVCHELAFAVFTEEIKILLISTHLLIIVLSL